MKYCPRQIKSFIKNKFIFLQSWSFTFIFSIFQQGFVLLHNGFKR